MTQVRLLAGVVAVSLGAGLLTTVVAGPVSAEVVSEDDADIVVAEPDYPGSFQATTFTLFGRKALSPQEVRRARRAATRAGAQAFVIRNPTLSMVRYTREGKKLTKIPRGWRVPMGTIVRPVELVRILGGDDMAAVLERGEVLLGNTSANIRKAKVGDVITVLDRRSKRKDLVVGAIVSDAFTSSGDLLISDVTAAQLGVKTSPRVTFVGTENDARMRRTLAQQGFVFNAQHRLARSGVSRDPDSTLGIARIKEMFGEFAYRRVGNYAISVDVAWRQRSIAHRVTYENISLTHNCHVRVISAVQAALKEIDEAGLADEIDINNSNRYGGCYTGRFSRQAEKGFGNLSRHSWGIAIDVNTTTNGRGTVPQMNCDVVRIFRKHGFAWGGNFIVPDGMHFEYVGQPRDTMQYRSQYCPNVPA